MSFSVRWVALMLVGAVVFLSGCIQSESAMQEGPPESDATVEDLRKENDDLRDELKRLRKENLSSRRGETVEILSTDVYFRSGSADLTPEGVEKLTAVADQIKREYDGRLIRVEGHTDDRPIAGKLKEKYPSNWELSAARSAAVVRHLQWTHEIDPERFEVVAFGPYQPVATNDTKEGRSRNRRVRVAVLPESAEETAGADTAGTESRW
jgi:chemotaxis protein MotB